MSVVVVVARVWKFDECFVVCSVLVGEGVKGRVSSLVRLCFGFWKKEMMMVTVLRSRSHMSKCERERMKHVAHITCVRG